MKKNCTEVVFILDRSGSMCGLEKDTIGGFNSLINKQKKQDGEVLVSTVLFNDSSVVIHNRKPIDEVRLMTNKDYEVYGCTALLDALGSSIRHIGNVHKYARNEDVPEHTMFVIITDGMENASRYGIDKDHAVNYQSDSVGTRLNYEVLDEAIQCICSGAPLPKSWKSKIEKRK